MAAKFEIRQPKAGEFSWVLVSQGRTLATGETYSRKVSCVNAIESLRKAASTAAVDDTAPTRGKAGGAKATAKTTATATGRTARSTAKVAAKTGNAPRTVAAGAAKKAAPRQRAQRGS